MSYKITDTIIVDNNKNIASIGTALFAGPVIIGGGTSTGTVSQPLQVTGTNGAYIGGNLGIGSTNPSSKLWVSGDIYNAGVHTAYVLNASKDPGTGIATDFTNSLFGNGWRVSSPGSTTYYKLATLPPGGGGSTFDHLIINGVLGAWTNGNQTPFEITFSNRGSFNYKYVSYGSVRSDVRIIGISTNSSVEIWAQHQASQFTKLVYNIPNSIESIVVSNPTSTTTAPTGTTVFDSSTVTPRFIINESDNVGIGTATPGPKLHVVGDGRFTGVVTATSFSGNLKGGSGGTIVYQSATDTTAFLANGTGGYVLQSNGGTSAPSWVPAAPAGAVSGLTIRDFNNSVVGTAGSVSQLTFGSAFSVTGTTGAAGIATITLSSNIVGSALSIAGISTFTNGPVIIGSATSTGTASQPLQVTGGAYVSGNLGIGTANPQNTLDVGVGTIRLINKSSTGRFSQIYQDNNLIFSNSSTNDDFDWTNSSGSRMRLYGTGNLVIPGTFTPTGTAAQRLQVDGGAYVSGNLGVGDTNGEGIKLFVSQGAPAANRPVALITDDGTIPTMTSGATLRISNDGSGNTFALLEAESNAGKLVFTNAGNLGIGTTNPGATLNVVPTATSIAGLFSGTTSSDMVRITQLGTGNALVVEDETPEGSPFVVTGVGTVGIGITNPSIKLTVNGGLDSSNRQVRFVNSGSGDLYIKHANLVSSIEAGSGVQLALGGNGAEGVRINSTGVGIGTTNPTSKLQVSGDVSVSGVVTATTFVGALTGTASSTTNIPNLTGAITSNNTTTSLGSFTSAQLATALTDETGSGANVFATSPVLVTPSLGIATATSINASGIITATQLSTGASGTGVNITTDTISGPATLTIDPAGVGDNTGAVRIKGDLYVDGTQFIVNSTTIELADFNVGIATTVGTNALLDGAGIGIGSTSIRKTLTWSNSSTALKSSEDFDVASGKVYKIAGTSVLSNNTLGSGVVTSSLTSVGTLTNLNVGNINSTGIITATTFVGALTGTATSISGGLAGNVVYQSAPNATAFLVNGTSGFILQSNGVGNAPTWVAAAPSGAVTGLIIRDSSNNIVGTSGSVSQLTFGTGLSVTGSTGAAGIATITLSSNIVGSALSIAGISTFTNGPVFIGSATSTGTASQTLQVTGGAYVSGNLGIGTTNPRATLNVVPTASSIAGLFSGTTSSDMVRITQLGTGNALVVEDSANPDSSPFVVNASGSVGIGTNNPTVALQLSPNASISNVGSGITLAGTVGSALTVAQFLYLNNNANYLRIKATRNATGGDWTTASTKLLTVTDVTEQGYIEYNPSGSTSGMAFGSGATEWARFTSVGNFGVGSTNPNVKFEVFGGTSRFAQSGQGDVSITHSSLVSSIRGASTIQLALGANNTDVIRINTSGLVGIGTTNPRATLNVVPTATSIAGLFSGTTSSDMVRITQLGTGNALVVEDSANPDSSPFVVTGIGSVGIGTASPAFTADIAGDARITSTNKMRFGGTAGTTNFYIQYNSTTNSLDFVAG